MTGDTRYLIHEGYRYYKNNSNKNNTYWLCQGYQRFGCLARAVVSNVDGKDIIKKVKGVHIHPPECILDGHYNPWDTKSSRPNKEYFKC